MNQLPLPAFQMLLLILYRAFKGQRSQCGFGASKALALCICVFTGTPLRLTLQAAFPACATAAAYCHNQPSLPLWLWMELGNQQRCVAGLPAPHYHQQAGLGCHYLRSFDLPGSINRPGQAMLTAKCLLLACCVLMPLAGLLAGVSLD